MLQPLAQAQEEDKVALANGLGTQSSKWFAALSASVGCGLCLLVSVGRLPSAEVSPLTVSNRHQHHSVVALVCITP